MTARKFFFSSIFIPEKSPLRKRFFESALSKNPLPSRWKIRREISVLYKEKFFREKISVNFQSELLAIGRVVVRLQFSRPVLPCRYRLSRKNYACCRRPRKQNFSKPLFTHNFLRSSCIRRKPKTTTRGYENTKDPRYKLAGTTAEDIKDTKRAIDKFSSTLI